jgi:transcriptional regulator with XRE-family HTH domain
MNVFTLKCIAWTLCAVTKYTVNYKELVGQKVKSHRLLAALSQEELAARCGIYRTYLSRIETGTANPSLVVIVALAQSLNLKPHELLMI